MKKLIVAIWRFLDDWITPLSQVRQELPPRPPECYHRYILVEVVRKNSDRGADDQIVGWKRVDRFCCEKCLEQREVIKEERAHNPPTWW